MGTIILCIILVLLAVGVFVFGRVTINRGLSSERVVSFRWAGLILVGLAVMIFALASTTTVQAKNVGVLTTYGKVSDKTLSPGLHFKAPWQRVTELDGTIQTDEYRGEDGCIYVRIGDGSQSCVTLAHRWQIIPERANEIYGSYRTDDPTKSLRDAVVSTQLKAVVQDVMSAYNPISSLQVAEGDETATPNFSFNYDEISSKIQSKMDEEYGTDPLVNTVKTTVSYISLAKSTQDKINAFVAEQANTRIAKQKIETAKNEAAANAELSASVSDNPNVLVSKCYDIVIEAQKSGYALPAGFSCWPGSNSAVVVPSTK